MQSKQVAAKLPCVGWTTNCEIWPPRANPDMDQSALRTPEAAFLQPITVVERPYHYFTREQRADASLLVGTGLSLQDLASPDRYVARWQEFSFVRNLLGIGDETRVALETGRSYRLGCFGVMGLAMATCETLLESLLFLFNHVELTFTPFRVGVHSTGDNWLSIRFEPRLPLGDLQRFFMERDLACTVGMIRDLSGLCWQDDVMRLHSARQDDLWHEAVMQVLGITAHPLHPTSSPALEAEICLCRQALSQPLALANPLQHHALAQQAFTALQERRLLSRHAQVKVWQLLATQRCAPSLETVAGQLAMSPRTLRRKLAEEDTHFQALVDLFRESQARELLLGSDASVEWIADRLGYGEASAFVHAFKRWTGKTPGQFRRRG